MIRTTPTASTPGIKNSLGMNGIKIMRSKDPIIINPQPKRNLMNRRPPSMNSITPAMISKVHKPENHPVQAKG
jgi:hypothetical protein